MGLFAELKRRNVIRMAALYLVGAWLIVQVAGTVLPMFGAPNWLPRSIVVLLALGLVPALVFSWLYELTSAGLKRDVEVTPEQSIASQTGRRMDRLIVVGLVVVVALVAADRYWPHPAKLDAGKVAGSTAIMPASIAVLPFSDLSPEGDQEYFSDGVAEEILNVLVRIDGLKVASRTSSFQFRTKTLGIRAIARELGVRHILEGSVRKAGDTIRVTAQLIDAETDAHLWSETFDRPLTTETVFAIQDEIAAAAVAALRQRLGIKVGEAVPASIPTANVDAYELYLKGRTLFQARRDLNVADRLLEDAVAIDPQFADALATRAALHQFGGEYGGDFGHLTQITRMP